MGFYTNYEVEFGDMIDWDDSLVKQHLQGFNVQYLYLRDTQLPRLMLCVYSQNPVEKILDVLKNLYHVDISYRIYNTNMLWVKMN